MHAFRGGTHGGRQIVAFKESAPGKPQGFRGSRQLRARDESSRGRNIGQRAAKMKIRFTSVDCAAEVAFCNQRLLGLRLANVYDINPKVR
jgi:hypothetical protein